MATGSKLRRIWGNDSDRQPIKVLVAIDFDEQTVIRDWGEGLTGDKVPTVLRYENGGTTGIYDWGFEARDRGGDRKAHEWFKLGLCPNVKKRLTGSSELNRKLPSMTALPPVTTEQCRQLVVDYLVSLANATHRHLQAAAREIYELPREYIITVPAMWDHAAQEAMRECAAEALLGDKAKKEQIQMVAEPEAAGLYALTSIHDVSLGKGDTFVICDAGGGTVDLSSYQIISKGRFNDLKRVSTISGDLCGSSFLNRLFEAYMVKKFQDIDWETSIYQKLLKTMVNEFDRIKQQFTGTETEDFVFIAIMPEAEDGALRVPARELREKVFDPVISKIRALVRDQIKATVKSSGKVKEVLLAGGFGENAYLKTQLEKEVGAQVKVRKIVQSSTAIVRGALMAGFSRVDGPKGQQGENSSMVTGTVHGEQGRTYARKSARVAVREAPRCYGTRIWQPYDPDNTTHQNALERRVIGPSLRYEIEVIKWFVSKGDDIRDGEAVKFELSHRVDIAKGEDRPKILCDVYSSDADDPPQFPHTDTHPEPSISEPLASLCIDLNTIPRESLPTTEKNGREYYDVDFDVYMTLNSAELTFVLGRGKDLYKPANVTVN
ncbi:hypothetical protein E0Z10_g5039 [Xylaria hypoxylon]|uniref:Uncharacterized protein n=1 Tax=Xylaria hypoxylon TaxID=37992 RepID=A0A4Z0YIJ4_9PEZI|nr:hypothetical protein E0Z10_g5039 [Xylaria hypoxylon]